MRLAILVNKKDIIVEYPTEVFKRELVTLSEKYGVEKAFDMICAELKRETITK